ARQLEVVVVIHELEAELLQRGGDAHRLPPESLEAGGRVILRRQAGNHDVPTAPTHAPPGFRGEVALQRLHGNVRGARDQTGSSQRLVERRSDRWLDPRHLDRRVADRAQAVEDVAHPARVSQQLPDRIELRRDLQTWRRMKARLDVVSPRGMYSSPNAPV